MKILLKNFTSCIIVLSIFFLYPSSPLSAQNNTPCECAQRWTGGAAWNPDGTVNSASNTPLPHGVIKCGSAASTQSGIMPEECTYNSSNFNIDLTQFPICLSPNTGLPVSLVEPIDGCDIIWLNFDVRDFAGSYDYQIVTNDNIAWALYNVPSSLSTKGTDPITDLSGDCSTLQPLACGDGFNNSFVTFDVPAFPDPTNLYIAIWDQENCNPGSSLSLNFKARFGCGDSNNCTLFSENETVSCNTNGTYSISVPISGTNGTYTAIDNTSGDAVSSAVVLTNLGENNPVVTGTVTAIYPVGVDYDFTITETTNDVDNSDDCEAPYSGTAPVCCALTVDCVALISASYSCLSSIPASDNSLITVAGACGPVTITSEDVVSGGLGCSLSDEITLTRTYTVSDGTTTENCIQVFTVITPTPSITCSADITVSCLTDVNSGTAIAIDGCGGSVSVLPSTPILITGQAECSGAVYQITYTATDDCNRTAICTQNFTLDNAPPTITCPADATVNCLADIAAGTATVGTSCSLMNEVISSTPILISGQAECAGAVYQITYTATDDCNRTAICTQNFTLDNAPPTITCPADATVSCLADIVAGTATVGTSCSLMNEVISSTPVLISGQAECAGAVYQITYTATDDCNRTAICTQNFTLDNAPPTITCPADVTVNCSTDITSGIPVFNSTCGLVSGDFTASQAVLTAGTESCDNAVYTIVYGIVDDCGREATCNQEITLSVNGPSIVCPVIQTVECVADIAAGLPVFSTDCDLLVQPLSVSAVTLLSGQDFCGGATYGITHTVTDDCGKSASCVQNFTLNTGLPIIDFDDLVDVECEEDVLPSIDDLVFTLPCGQNGTVTLSGPSSESNMICPETEVSYIYTLTTDCGEVYNYTRIYNFVNEGITILNCFETFEVDCESEITPSLSDIDYVSACGNEVFMTYSIQELNYEGCGELYQVIYNLTDNCGNTASCTKYWLVEYPLPDFSNLENYYMDLTWPNRQDLIQAWIDGLTADSFCGNPFTYTITNNYNQNNFVQSGCSYATAEQEITFTLTDDCGREISETATIFLEDNTGPTCIKQYNLTLDCDDADFDARVSQWLNYSGGNVTDYSHPVMIANDFPDDFVISDAQNGFLINWTATDQCDNVTVFSSILTIEDNTSPVIMTAPENIEVVASQNTIADFQGWLDNQGGAVAEDNCSEVSWTYFPENPLEGINSSFSGATITFIASDAFGNTVSITSTYSITGTLPLQFLDFPADVQVKCADGAPVADFPEVLYNCELPEYEMTDYWTVGECCNETVLSRHWIFTDDCEYQCSATQTISFYDNEAPAFSFANEELDGVANGDTIEVMMSEYVAGSYDLIAIDNVSEDLEISEVYEITDTLNCFLEGYSFKAVRLLTCEDDCGNKAEFECTLELYDDIAPVFTYVPDNQVIACGETPQMFDAEVEDNLGIVNITYEEVESGQGCPGMTFITRIWTAMDGCGNTSMAFSHITYSGQGINDTDADERLDDRRENESAKERKTLVFTPSLANDFTILSFFAETNGEAEIHLYNSQGMLILRKDIAVNGGEVLHKLDISNLLPGTHFVTLNLKGKSVRTGRFLKIQ